MNMRGFPIQSLKAVMCVAYLSHILTLCLGTVE